MISLNFKNMSNARFCTAKAMHDEVTQWTSQMEGKELGGRCHFV